MYSVFIETSTERGFVALFKESVLVRIIELPVGFNNSKFLLPAVEEIFKDAGIHSKDLGLVGAGIGPGSYTGIRVGAVAAKALAFAHKIPLVGVCSLFGFIPENDGMFAAMIDAKIGGAYVVTGEKLGEKIVYTCDPQVVPLENVPVLLKDVSTIVSPVVGTLQQKLIGTWEWQECAPCPQHMMNIAVEAFRAGHHSPGYSLDLMYLRKTQAELNAQQP